MGWRSPRTFKTHLRPEMNPSAADDWHRVGFVSPQQFVAVRKNVPLARIENTYAR